MVLQRLAKREGLARPFTQHDGLIEKMLFELPADEVDLGAKLFQQMQTVTYWGVQAVELDHRLVETARRLAKVGLGQRRKPVFEIANAGLAERERPAVRCR